MPRRIRRSSSKPRKAKRRKPSRAARQRSVQRRKAKQVVEAKAHYRALTALLVFLYVLRLIDEKTMNRIRAALSPKPVKHRRRRKRRGS